MQFLWKLISFRPTFLFLWLLFYLFILVFFIVLVLLFKFLFGFNYSLFSSASRFTALLTLYFGGFRDFFFDPTNDFLISFILIRHKLFPSFSLIFQHIFYFFSIDYRLYRTIVALIGWMAIISIPILRIFGLFIKQLLYFFIRFLFTILFATITFPFSFGWLFFGFFVFFLFLLPTRLLILCFFLLGFISFARFYCLLGYLLLKYFLFLILLQTLLLFDLRITSLISLW